MKKRILSVILVVILVFILTGCGTSVVESKTEEENTSMFVCVERTPTWKVIYHKDTKVMYATSSDYYNSGVFTLLVNADGTPMLWEK